LQHPPSVGALLQRGRRLHHTGQVSAAEALYRQVLADVPDHPEALYLLGTALLQLGQPEQAVDRLERAVRALRNDSGALGNLAQAYFALGRYRDAEEAFRKASRLDSRNVYFQLGIASAVAMRGEPGEAESLLRRLASRFPGTALVWFNLGNALRDQRRLQDALPCYRKALDIDPQLTEAHNNLGNVLHTLYRFDEAERAYRACIATNPDYFAAQYNLASVLIDVGRFREAEGLCREIIRRAPAAAMAHNFHGAALGHQGRLLEALACHRRALEVAPRDAKVVEIYAAALADAGDFEEALKCFSRALALSPDSTSAHGLLGNALLAQGRLTDGWVGYAYRPAFIRFREQYPDICLSRALPLELAGKYIVLTREQGLGDEIFFLRFAPALAAAGARVTCRASNKIRQLLARVGCLAEVVEETAPVPQADVVMLLGDLPRALSAYPASALRAPANQDGDFGTTPLASRISVFWPLIPPTLRVDPLETCLATMRQRLAEAGSPPYIGVTWRGGTSPQEQHGDAVWNLHKEIGFELLGGALRDLPGTFIALQRNPGGEEIEHFSRAFGRRMHDFSALNEDLESMLALLALLDEYVGVSNTNMHLRAVAGRTARVLIPCPAEWRWMFGHSSSPWFPGFSLYRQSLDGSWRAALARLSEDLSVKFRQLE
jgi:tetratricopeptide (TPR) repeat protein